MPRTAKKPPAKFVESASQINTAHGMDAKSLAADFLSHLQYTLAELPGHVDSEWEPYVSLALSVRDRMIERWIHTQQAYYKEDAKRVYYLSLEFLMGRTLGNSLVNLGLFDEAHKALHELGYNLEELREAEWDAGLGNGGLGRLAACFLDSLATLAYPSYGYGIRYDYGIFHQRIVGGAQHEVPDAWLRYGNPWEIARPGDLFRIQFGGQVTAYVNDEGRWTNQWVNTTDVLATPFDTPIPGYGNKTVNTLRLWSAKANMQDEFDLAEFNEGDYVDAIDQRAMAENISRVLYPADNTSLGRELRLKQEYFFVSATVQDIILSYKKRYELYDKPQGLKTFDRFTEKVSIQLNDTHPALAIAELMRILMDLEGLDWNEAWGITQKVFAYTNHTVLPEALERWPLSVMQRILPRHVQIIFEINHRFLEEVRQKFPNDDGKMGRMSIIEEGDEKRVRMANLAIVGGHSVNGVAALHTEIIKNDIFRDFHEMWPERFNNKTNGITQRRWLKKCNKPLAALITDAIGEKWTTDLFELKKLQPLSTDASFQERWRQVKRENKDNLINIMLQQYAKRGLRLKINPDSIFDCQIKRMHEYKRQLLNVLHVITLYNRIKDNPHAGHTPRTVIFAGKAAPAYWMAKHIIRLINAVGDVVNNDPTIGDLLNVVFLADYRVSLAEDIFPAADLSEQISTAGTEASGTGNMKFMLNGALTIGTMDGANVEICEEVGRDNIFIFGMNAHEAQQQAKQHDPWWFYNNNMELKRVMDEINNGHFSPHERELFQPIFHSLLHHGDHYLLMADYAPYVECQRTVSQTYRDQHEWTRKSILNVAAAGKFSSDRTIEQYAQEIWGLKKVQAQ